MIIENVEAKIRKYNLLCLHYNLIADQIYKAREEWNPFDENYLRYIVAGLVSFDMERMMGKGLDRKYVISANGFASRLHHKLHLIKPLIHELINANLPSIEIPKYSLKIESAYNVLSATGEGALNEDSNDAFHVGASKILHFLIPKLFLIVDSNAARAFRLSHRLPFKNTTQPGYSSDLYIRCLSCAKDDIESYDAERFQTLEAGVPIARIYDKLAFATGSGW